MRFNLALFARTKRTIFEQKSVVRSFAEKDDSANDVSVFSANRRSRKLNGDAFPGHPDQDTIAAAQGLLFNVGLAQRAIQTGATGWLYHLKYAGRALAQGFFHRPTRELLGTGVHEENLPAAIGGEQAISDAVERVGQPQGDFRYGFIAGRLICRVLSNESSVFEHSVSRSWKLHLVQCVWSALGARSGKSDQRMGRGSSPSAFLARAARKYNGFSDLQVKPG
jgi:hypothetical protein